MKGDVATKDNFESSGKLKNRKGRKIKGMENVYDAIMGLVVGDALGVPFEFKKWDTFTVTDMRGYGTYNQPPFGVF